MENDEKEVPVKKNIKTIIWQKFDKISDKYKKTKATEKLKKVVEIAEKNKSHENYFQEKDWMQIRKYVDKGADCNQVKISGDQETLLIKAIKDQQFDFVRDLIDGGVDVNACDKFGYTPLHTMLMKSSQEFSIAIFKKLLVREANPNASTTDDYKHNPLCLAIKNRHNCAISLLIDYGVDINKGDRVEYLAPLIYAIKNDNFMAVQALLSKGASLAKNVDMIGGKNAFHFLVHKPKEYIENFMACARFDFHDPKQDEMMRNAILSLKYWGIGSGKNKIFLPDELHSHILKYLVSDSCYGEWDKIARIKIMKTGDRVPFDIPVNKQREFLRTILATPDNSGKTAFQYLPPKAKEDNGISSLFDFDRNQLNDDNSSVVKKLRHSLYVRDKAQLLLKDK